MTKFRTALTAATVSLAAATATAAFAPPAEAAVAHNTLYNQLSSAYAVNTYTDGHCLKGRHIQRQGAHSRADVQSFKVNAEVAFKTNRHGYWLRSANQCIDVNNGAEDSVSVYVYPNAFKAATK